jgi:hypothetical protein
MKSDETREHQNYHHGNLENDLIEEGIKSLCKDGLGSFSIRDLSRKLGVSHAAAYRHFPSREDLLRAILIEVSRRFTAALVNAVPPELEGREALLKLGVEYVKFFVRQPELLALFTMLPAEGNLVDSLVKKAKAKENVRVECGAHANCDHIDEMPETTGFGVFRKYAVPMKQLPEYSHLSEREILLGFWGKVHGLATIIVTQQNFIDPDTLDQTIERVVRTAF